MLVKRVKIKSQMYRLIKKLKQNLTDSGMLYKQRRHECKMN